jgi:hypothetical protein
MEGALAVAPPSGGEPLPSLGRTLFMLAHGLIDVPPSEK